MLLSEEDEKVLVNRLIEAARRLIERRGQIREDAETGLVHTECRLDPFLIIEHQRQRIKTGWIHTNGIDLWELRHKEAAKLLSVQYLPFQIKHFAKAGKAPWIETFLEAERTNASEVGRSEGNDVPV